ncbi:hypothetical protein [Brevundimonas sp.]|uniref:hypothetical protein n=1 Tax=Brevundimonas sp. TaxID=1871086 RepID=UPI0025ED90D8|nr:hypothetical protein [Brevundimonas sp.]
MRKFAHLAAVAALAAAPAALIAAPAAAQQSASAYPTYEDVGLAWVRGPSVRDMARFYRTTRHDGGRGLAEVLCTAEADGRLDCSILNEEPNNRQFGLAGVRVMERARVRAVDGGSPAGRTFAFTLRFGNWPPSRLPDRFHPTDFNLRWVDRPSMVGHWNMQGQDRGESLEARFDCRAMDNGRLDCSLTSADSMDFGQAALEAMRDARVERADGGQLAGSPLQWTIRIERQSGCGTGGAGRSGSYPATGTGTGPSVGAPDPNVASATPPSSVVRGQEARETQGGMPGCQSAMVQVY